MKLQEQTAGVAKGLTFGIAAPQRSSLGKAVGTRGRPVSIILVPGSLEVGR